MALKKKNRPQVFFSDAGAPLELPNYNPVGITNSSPGQDFAAKAATVFSKQSGETDSSASGNGGSLI